MKALKKVVKRKIIPKTTHNFVVYGIEGEYRKLHGVILILNMPVRALDTVNYNAGDSITRYTATQWHDHPSSVPK